MKFQTLNYWGASLFALMLATSSTCSQNPHCKITPYKIDSAAVAEANEEDKFYESFLNLTNRIEREQAVMLDNELEPSDDGGGADFQSNPLWLNGKSLEYADFTIGSKGILAVLEGDPASPQAAKIPFKIFLRREGKIIYELEKEVSEIEISKILSLARPDDHLIIAPARKSDWKAKRILQLVGGC